MEVAMHQSLWPGVARQFGTDRLELRSERAESLNLRRIQLAGERRCVLQQRVDLRCKPFEATVQAPYRQQVAHPRRLVHEERQAGRGLEVDITRGSMGA